MFDALKAKMRLNNIQKFNNEQENIELQAVYSNDPESPNYSWSKYTPSGSLKLTISNPAAHGFFEFGKEYLITIEKKDVEDGA